MSRPNFNDMDWQSLLDSEIFTNYMKNELIREAEQQAAELMTPENLNKQAEEQLQIQQELADFRNKVASSPKLQAYFKECRKLLANNKELAKQVDPRFIQGIRLLNLDLGDDDISGPSENY